ncbi:hypothetical protein Tco_0359193 [Tanacetum coccineum]
MLSLGALWDKQARTWKNKQKGLNLNLGGKQTNHGLQFFKSQSWPLDEVWGIVGLPNGIRVLVEEGGERQRQKLELEEHVLGLFELHNEWTDVELQGNEGFIVVGSMSFLQECLMKASENYRGDGKFFELHQKYVEVFKNPVEIGYFKSSSDDGNDGDGIDDDGGNDGDGIDDDDDDGGNDGGNGDADDDGENDDDVGHVFSKEFDKPPSDSSKK